MKRTYHLEVHQVKALTVLSEKTRVRQVDYVREAIDDLIVKYKKDLPKDLVLGTKRIGFEEMYQENE